MEWFEDKKDSCLDFGCYTVSRCLLKQLQLACSIDLLGIDLWGLLSLLMAGLKILFQPVGVFECRVVVIRALGMCVLHMQVVT